MMKRLVVLPVLAMAVSLLGSGSALASGGSTFGYHAGDSLLAGLGFPTPDVAIADNGDTVTVAASGSFDVAAKSATGGGTFEHRAPDGTLRASGTLTATKLIDFQPFGCSGSLCGGRADILTHLVGHPASDPSQTVEADAILVVICDVGSPPPGQMEGIRLNVQDLINFSKSVSGVTVFIQ